MLDGLRSWLLGPPTYRFDFTRAKHRCRIILIDDDENALPIKDLQRDGYNITQRVQVDSNLLTQCETGVYDIIILDYNGIAPISITPGDGFGVFDRIRAANPQQYIISVSAQTYDISKTLYFKNANDWLRKPTDLSTTKDKIDDGVRFLFDKSAILLRLKTFMHNEHFGDKSISRVITHLNNNSYTDIDELCDRVKRIAKISEVSDNILGALKSIIKISAG